MARERRRQRVEDLVATVGAPVVTGRVERVVGLVVEAFVPDARLGDMIEVRGTGGVAPCEVVGFRDQVALAIPLGPLAGVAPGAPARARPGAAEVAVGPALLGRVVDAFARPIDGLGPLHAADRVPVDPPAPPICERGQVADKFATGVRVIDGLLTCGRGQRVGIFAGAGVGKSVLTEQIATQSFADVVVVGLVGERGREVRELMRSSRRDTMVMVAATSDRSPMERARGARTATAVAEYFRDRGKSVLLVIDSLTRYAMAMREIGLAVGEPPATKGYPPSVFAALPRLLERVCPMNHGGSITGFYTVLVEGDDLSDPVADSARSLLDAHIVLSRALAGRGQFPAVDVLSSASRVARQVSEPAAIELMQRARAVLDQRGAVLELQSLGAYQAGTNKAHDEALAVGARLDAWARQSPHERVEYGATVKALGEALGGAR